MKRLGVGLMVLAAIGAAAWWLWPRGRALVDALPAETVSVAVLDDPKALAQRLDQVTAPLTGRLGTLETWFAADGRAAALGFDPAAGFEAIGLGARGAAMARLSRLDPGVLCLDLVDRARFATWLGARGRGAARFEADALVIGAARLPWIAQRGWTCISAPRATPTTLRAAFTSDTRLADAPLAAALPPGPGLRGAWSARQATRWAHAVGRTRLAEDLGHLAAYVASAAATLHDRIALDVRLTPEGRELADRLFAPRAARVARYVAREGWIAARLALALPTAPDALTTALPPSVPAAKRQAVALGRMALPMTAGVSWDQLTRALDGQITVAVDARSRSPQPPRLLILGVADAQAAREVVTAIARKFGEGGGLLGLGAAQTERIGAVDAWRLAFKSGPTWVHLTDDAIIAASSPAALTLALSGAADPAPAWATLDAADAVLAVAGDLHALAARLPEGAPREQIAPRAGLAIRRAQDGLALVADAASGVELNALIGLGLWLAGR